MIDIPEIYKDRYFINTDSLYREYGVVVEKGGYEELMKEPKRKQGYSHSWYESNGTERFVLDAFETRNVTLVFTFVCESLEEYQEKHSALFNILKSGYFSLQVTTLGKKWTLLYDNETSSENLTDIYRGGMAIVRHTLNFLDDNTISSQFLAQAFLTDENGVFLTDENNNLLTIGL